MATRKKIPLIPTDSSIAITAAKTLTVPLDASVSGTNTGDQDLSVLVTKATYDAHSVLYATTDNTPVALTVGEQTLVGRVTGGNISAIAIDSDLSSVSANDDTIPSAKATKAALDLKAPIASPTFTGTLTVPVGLTGVLRADTGVVSVDSDVTDIVAAGTSTAAGKLELATDAETVTGSDTARATTPANITAKMSAPGAIGNTTASTGKFTSVETTGAIELGAAADTTISRVSAGVVAIESVNILTVAGGTLTGNLTLGENTSIALDPAGSADGKYSGITVTGVSGYSQAFGDLVTLDKDDSRWEAVDISVAAAATGDARGIFGMVVSAGTDGNACTILLHGIIRADANFPALTIGAAVYASTTGDIVVAQPTTTDHVIRIVGYALTADEIYFNPENDWISHT